MIRFIDLGKQIGGDDDNWPRQFAFFNTVSSIFVQVNLEETWESWHDFKTCVAADPNSVWDIERYRDLCPEWVFVELQVQQYDSLGKGWVHS